MLFDTSLLMLWIFLLVLISTSRIFVSGKITSYGEKSQEALIMENDLDALKALMEDRLNRMQDQIDVLNAENTIQKDLLQRAAKKIAGLERHMSHLMTTSPASSVKRWTRSINMRDNSNNNDDENYSKQASSPSRLEISPTLLGSMPYGDYRINIYAHFRNKVEPIKKFYYFPMFLLNHANATSFLNNVTKEAQVRFTIEMWNDEIEKEILKYISTKLVNHTVHIEQIQVLPIEELKLSAPDHLKARLDYYQMDETWFKYQQHPKSVDFTFTCPKANDCDELAHQMRSNPRQFNYLKLVVRLSSLMSKRRDLVIRIENIVKGDLMATLTQRYPETVYLTAEDENKLLSQAINNIVVDTTTDSPEMLTEVSDSEKRNILMNLLNSSRVSIEKESDVKWDSVFWNDENSRPDKVAETLNDMLHKLDAEKKRSVTGSLNDKKNVGIEADFLLKIFGLGFSGNREKETNVKYSEDELNRLSTASKNTVMWKGEKFIPKTMNLTRINLANLKNSKEFRESSVKVNYTTSILYLNVNIKENLGSQFVDEILHVKTKLRDLSESLERPKCYQSGKAPSSCWELHCIGYKLNGFYSVKGHKKMETVYCDFDKLGNNQKIPATSGFETRIGFSNIKSMAGGVYFYVQRATSFSAPDSVIPFHIERLNIGQAMNVHQGVFTAPRNGTYYFAFIGMKDWTGIDLNIQLKLNEGTPKSMLVGTASVGDRNGYFSLGLKSTLKLVAGDRISLRKNGNGVLRDAEENHYTHFTGRLLDEDLSLP